MALAGSFCTALGLAGAAARAGSGWRLEALTGTALNAPMPLTIRQEGSPDIAQTARYDTRPFNFHAPYYAWRLGRWNEGGGWEFEHIHHKVVLRNPPPEVARFSVSHGYNMLFALRGWELLPFVLRAGAGVVVGHPESVVRGRTFEDEGGLFGAGYFLAGAAAQAAAAWRWPARGGLHLTAELVLTAAYARVPVAGGSADVPNIALHGLLGAGGEW